MSNRAIDFLPSDLQASAHVLDSGEVMWPANETGDVISALTADGRVILGLDVRRYYPDGTVLEIPWSSFEPEGADDVAASREAALSALHRGVLPGGWVLVTWR